MLTSTAGLADGAATPHASSPAQRARSFARIFFRNAINNGLLLIENDALPGEAAEGDSLTVFVNDRIEYRGKSYPVASMPDNLLEIIRAGGLVKAMRRRNGLD